MRSWAEELLEAKDTRGDYLEIKGVHDAFVRLLGDWQVASHLMSFAKEQQVETPNDAIRLSLLECALRFQLASAQSSHSSSTARDALRSLAAKLEDVADALNEVRTYVGPAIKIEYLLERKKANDDDVLFTERHFSKGIRPPSFVPGFTVIDLLEQLSLDLRRRIASPKWAATFPSRKKRRSTRAAAIDLLTHFFRSHFRSTPEKLIAAMVGAMSDETTTSDMVRKRTKARR